MVGQVNKQNKTYIQLRHTYDISNVKASVWAINVLLWDLMQTFLISWSHWENDSNGCENHSNLPLLSDEENMSTWERVVYFMGGTTVNHKLDKKEKTL